MILDNQLFEDINSLPPEKKAEVIDLVQRLKNKKQQDSPSRNRRAFGSMKGLVIHMADDFDEPLEDFAEYM